MNDLKGLNAYITGASRGIGKAIAKKLAEAGVNIAIISTNLSKSQLVAEELKKTYGVETWAAECDVSQPEQVDNLTTFLDQEIGAIHIAFNNAGVCKHQSAFDTTYEDWRYVLDINLTGVFLTSKMAAKLMIKHEVAGSIINMASMSSHIVNIPQQQAAYNASKAGVVHLSKSLAVEWTEHKLRVNSISPGYIATEMALDTPKEMRESWYQQSLMPRMGTPEELFNAIAYLASPSSSFTTGTDVIIDGGFTCL